MSQDSGASVEHNSNPVGDSGNVEGETVKLETHRRLLDEKKSVQRKLDELQAWKKEREEEDARKAGDYVKLLKDREDALAAKDAELSGIKGMILEANKKNAVLDAIGNSVDPKWHKLISVSDIAVNPETGEIDAMSVAKVAESFKRDFPEALKAKAPILPGHAPKGTNQISYEDWKKLPYAEMCKYDKSQIIG